MSAVKDDSSLKNVSSIVFEVLDLRDKGRRLALFTGDASACRIFRGKWTGEPIFYDLIKSMFAYNTYGLFIMANIVDELATSSWPPWKLLQQL